MAHTTIEAEALIRENIQYNLQRFVDEELDKVIAEAKLVLDKRLREAAAKVTLTFAKQSSIKYEDGKYLIELSLPDQPIKGE